MVSFRTCLSCLISKRFISEGERIVSKIGLTDGPEYGGPDKWDPSAAASLVVPIVLTS